MQATRQEVYAVIDGERDYQDSKWNPADIDGSGGEHTPLEWLTYIEDYVAEAKRSFSRRPEKEAREFALHTLRKIGGMAVAALEQNGVRTRAAEGARPVGFRQA